MRVVRSSRDSIPSLSLDFLPIRDEVVVFVLI